jgi:hypothetical protein
VLTYQNQPWRFLWSAWNIFDTVVVVISLIPDDLFSR